jgi:hypothetical protein
MEEYSFEWLLGGSSPSGWVIDVWDCHGVLKPYEMAGYGVKNKLPEGWEWFDIGHFSIPIATKEKPLWEANERLRRKVEGFLWGILERRGGAINWSGWYNITVDEAEELSAIVQKYGRPEGKETNLAWLFEEAGRPHNAGTS